jgi:hypothetical protein
MREARLILAEELNKDLKDNLSVFIDSIEELDKAMTAVYENTESNINQDALNNFIKPVNDRIMSVRKHIAALDARIEKTINEWDNLKKDEIGLSVLENHIRKFLHQEQ